MARGVNKVILIGNLGNDPEVRFLPTGVAVANISVATSESWKDKTTGENQERTEWHRVVLYRRLAEIVGEYLRKGSKVYIEGKLRTRKWQDQSGADRYTTEILADELQMLDRLAGGGAGAGAGSNYSSNNNANESRQNFSNQEGGYPESFGAPTESAAPSAGQGDFDDDIPF